MLVLSVSASLVPPVKFICPCCVQLYTKLQLVKGEIKDVIDEHVMTRQELEQTQNELTRELKYK